MYKKSTGKRVKCHKVARYCCPCGCNSFWKAFTLVNNKTCPWKPFTYVRSKYVTERKKNKRFKLVWGKGSWTEWFNYFCNLNIVSTKRAVTKSSGFYRGLHNRKLVSSATGRDQVLTPRNTSRDCIGRLKMSYVNTAGVRVEAFQIEEASWILWTKKSRWFIK